jgi:hypothetical protein
MPDIHNLDAATSLKEYRKRAAVLLNALDNTEASLEDVLINTQDLLKRARKGFSSERVNMVAKDTGGVSELNEQLPNIEIQCLTIQMKVNEMLVKILEKDDLPDTTTVVNILPVSLEDTL